MEHHKHIILVGNPGSGKSTAARFIHPSVDIDDVIQKKLSIPLHKIVKTLGSDEFIEFENKTLCETITGLSQPTVVATGGSVVHHPGFLTLCKDHVVVWLYADILTIMRRIGNCLETRGITCPSEMSHLSVSELLRVREQMYRRCSNKKINSTENVFKVVDQIKALLCDVERGYGK